MTIRIDSIYVAPVKSLALNRVERARLGKRGIVGDRAFFLVDAVGRVFTARDHFPLVQVRAEYDAAQERLDLTVPNATAVSGDARAEGEHLAIDSDGWKLEGRVVEGPFAAALSEFVGRPLRFVRVTRGHGFDALPLSICSRESLEEFARVAGRASEDGRRFRQNLYVSGAGVPHAEDTWVGRDVRIGEHALVRVIMPDPRCVMTTRDPDTGEHELNTLKLITSYRTDTPKAANFGVYCGVVDEGELAVGDALEVLA
jgi:uncharacterized protein YcbX